MTQIDLHFRKIIPSYMWHGLEKGENKYKANSQEMTIEPGWGCLGLNQGKSCAEEEAGMNLKASQEFDNMIL